MRKQLLTSDEHAKAHESMNGFEESSYEAEPICFMEVEDYTTFRAEFAVKDEENIVFHFFATDEINQLSDPWKYWKDIFPLALEQVAVPYFQSGPPDLRAAYAEELASWWLQADGAANKVLDPDFYARKFLEKLDEDLDQKLKQNPSI